MIQVVVGVAAVLAQSLPARLKAASPSISLSLVPPQRGEVCRPTDGLTIDQAVAYALEHTGNC